MPNSRINSGVISDPPPIPVMPIRKPTPKPETEYRGSIKSKMLIRLARPVAAVFGEFAARPRGQKWPAPSMSATRLVQQRSAQHGSCREPSAAQWEYHRAIAHRRGPQREAPRAAADPGAGYQPCRRAVGRFEPQYGAARARNSARR